MRTIKNTKTKQKTLSKQNTKKDYTRSQSVQIKNSTCLVTGGAGFIGSHLVDALANTEHYNNNKVIILDNLSTGKLSNIAHHFENNDINLNKATAKANKNKEEQKKEDAVSISNERNTVTFINGDIRDRVLLQNIFQKYTPDYVFHQAAIPSVPRSVKDPILSNEANVNGTINILNEARKHNVKKIVYAASSSAYGDTPTLPKKESMPPLPLSPYAVSKLAGEMYCKAFYEVYGLKYVCLRYFNVYGARQDPKSEYAAVIPKVITRIQNDESPVIYGDGMQTRDFTFVSDVVQANIKAATSDAIGMFNVAGGKRISINHLAEHIAKTLKKNINPVYEDERPGDVKHSLADVTKAYLAFGYQPSYTIQKGLEETISWFEQNRLVKISQ